MVEKINNVLAGIPATLLGGIMLIFSFVLSMQEVYWALDPAWLTVVICGIPLVYLALWRIVHNPGISKISSALLITMAMLAAIAIGDLFAAGEVAFIMAIGAILEEKTTQRARKGLKKLLKLAPSQGRRILEGREYVVAIEEIAKGDILRVLPGETIPVDGIIVEGETAVDQSIMTGESLPVDKGQGDKVFCGTINQFGAVDIKATRVGEDSSLEKLIRMVKEAENKQAPMQRIADKWASWLVPIALVIAIAAWLAVGDIVRGVTVLVVFCPCALVLATPTAIMAAIGQATRHGVIIKSGEALERMGKVDTIAFDKTGTLTLGRLEVSDVISLNHNIGEEELLALTAAVESKSEHPLGKAVVAFAGQRNIQLPEAVNFKMTSGKGIYAQVRGKRLYCGNEKYLGEMGITLAPPVKELLLRLQRQGKASILVAEENNCIGLLALSDILRPEAPAMVQRLHSMNTKVVLLTGDNSQAAAYFAQRAGITSVRAELLPGDKVANIYQLSQSGKGVCMIGDGVNDAPALKTATVGVAMGSMGSDIAVEAADIALMSDDIAQIPYLKRLSNATVNTIMLSISLSMCINFVAVACSVLGLLTPTTGALVHNAGSCLVVLIAALLYDRKFDV